MLTSIDFSFLNILINICIILLCIRFINIFNIEIKTIKINDKKKNGLVSDFHPESTFSSISTVLYVVP